MKNAPRKVRVRMLVATLAGFLSACFVGCSDGVDVSPEKQAAGRKSKAEALDALTTKGGDAAKGKSPSKRKGSDTAREDDRF